LDDRLYDIGDTDEQLSGVLVVDLAMDPHLDLGPEVHHVLSVYAAIHEAVTVCGRTPVWHEWQTSSRRGPVWVAWRSCGCESEPTARGIAAAPDSQLKGHSSMTYVITSYRRVGRLALVLGAAAAVALSLAGTPALAASAATTSTQSITASVVMFDGAVERGPITVSGLPPAPSSRPVPPKLGKITFTRPFANSFDDWYAWFRALMDGYAEWKSISIQWLDPHSRAQMWVSLFDCIPVSWVAPSLSGGPQTETLTVQCMQIQFR